MNITTTNTTPRLIRTRAAERRRSESTTVWPIGVSVPAIAILALALGCSAWTAAADADPDASTIIARSTVANEADWAAAPSYGYEERVRDDDGTRTYDVTILDGTPYKRLTSVNGAPLSDEQKTAEDEKFARESAKRAAESADERHDRLEDYRKTRNRAHRILEELPHAFDFRLTAKKKVASGTAFVLRATPRSGYDPPNVEAEVLTGMSGEFWIDARTYQWVRAVARVLHPVTVEGFLARVQPGTQFEVEQTRVDDGVWLPRHFSIKSRAAILFLFHHHSDQDHSYYNYRKSPGSNPSGFQGCTSCSR